MNASRISAYVDPILKLLIDFERIDNLEKLFIRSDLIDSSITSNIRIERNIVFIDLSKRKDIKLFVK